MTITVYNLEVREDQLMHHRIL